MPCENRLLLRPKHDKISTEIFCLRLRCRKAPVVRPFGRGSASPALSCLRGKTMTEVAAALIWENDKFMICQRPRQKARGMLWEFVGGKTESGETREQALIRECREELGITVEVGEIFMEVVHAYEDITVHLTLFHAKIADGTPQLLEHNDLRWITPAQIGEYEFCPADKDILERIKQLYM